MRAVDVAHEIEVHHVVDVVKVLPFVRIYLEIVVAEVYPILAVLGDFLFFLGEFFLCSWNRVCGSDLVTETAGYSQEYCIDKRETKTR